MAGWAENLLLTRPINGLVIAGPLKPLGLSRGLLALIQYNKSSRLFASQPSVHLFRHVALSWQT
jgi:hypothetical protein